MTTEATTKFPPFLKWGDYPSKSSKNPDVLRIKVMNLEIFDTEFSTNMTAIVDGLEKTIPLWNFNSKNKALLRDWRTHIENGNIKEGTEFTLITHNQEHPLKKNWTIRRWEFIF